tara:strand:- start:1964 stop:2071 length:108 start_codon:yes stop_codon:yes gene_type:complete
MVEIPDSEQRSGLKNWQIIERHRYNGTDAILPENR